MSPVYQAPYAVISSSHSFVSYTLCVHSFILFSGILYIALVIIIVECTVVIIIVECTVVLAYIVPGRKLCILNYTFSIHT